MQEEGYLAKTFFEEGTKDIPLGQVLGVLVESQDEIEAFKDFQPAGTSAAVEPTPAAQPAAPVQTQAAATPV